MDCNEGTSKRYGRLEYSKNRFDERTLQVGEVVRRLAEYCICIAFAPWRQQRGRLQQFHDESTPDFKNTIQLVHVFNCHVKGIFHFKIR